MMRSLFSGVSGLKNHQTRMDVIGNNISNVNTTGFKSSRVTFSDMLSQNLQGASAPQENRGGTNPKQIGLGSSVASVDLIFTNGSVQSTGKNTDLYLSGSGLFVVKNSSGTYYTRNGAFEFDAAGNYVQPGNGLFVQGWTAGEDGTLTTTGAIGNIVVPSDKTMPSKATENVAYSGNLKADVPIITSISYTNPNNNTSYTVTTGGTYTGASPAQPLTLTFSDGTKQVVSTGVYTVGRSMPQVTGFKYYDSLGNAHETNVNFQKAVVGTVTYTDSDGNTKTDTATAWLVSLSKSVIKEDDGSTSTLSLPSTTLAFDSKGVLRAGTFAGVQNVTADTNSAVTVPTAEVPSAVGTTSVATSKLTAQHTSPNGSATDEITLDYTAVTQYANMNTIFGTPDGYAAGKLASVSIDSSGVITGTYTNDVKRAEAQVAVAQFNNPSGLTKTGDSLYQESNNSGVANVKTAADLGVTITPSALEMSNVDVANEFTDMIITQRGFQSNSKIITTSDEMLETLINIKR